MKTFRLLLCCCLAAPLLGCGKSLDEPVDPGRGAEAVADAFGAWQRGEAYGELARRQPPVYVNEPEWAAGKKLLKYEAGPVTPIGRQGRCTVKLTLQDASGKVTERAIGYQIDTTPSVVITRETLGP